MAASVLTTLPIVILFFLLQRGFLRGLSSVSSLDA
jgi:ABC-type glycerol-3-phosphate transport system permease component